MGRQFGSKREDKSEFYARQWFASMAKFHRVNNPATWEFTEDHLIAFLRFKLKQKLPTWKRLKIVEGVILYRNNVRQTSTPRLEMVRASVSRMLAASATVSSPPQDNAVTREGLQYRDSLCQKGPSVYGGSGAKEVS
jgi:hypothetical protein